MRFVPCREMLRASLLLSILVFASPAPAADLIQREPSTGAFDARRVVEPSYLTEGVQAREVVRVDASLLAAAPDSLWLELVPGEWRLAFLADLERGAAGGLVWRGRFAEDDPDHVSITLSLHEGVVVGSFEAGALRHTLRPGAGGATVLTTSAADASLRCAVGGEEDPQRRAGGGLAAEIPVTGPEPGPEAAGGGAAEAAAEGASTLSIVVLHLPTLTEAWGGKRFAVAYAHHAVDSLNTAFQNSRIAHRARLTDVREWRPTGFFGNITRLPDLAADDAWVSGVRDQAGGDLVVILADRASSFGGCGYANVMYLSRFGPQMAPLAFSTTNADCEGHDHFIFAHEIGHNLGGQHNPEATVPSNPVFPYALGYYRNGVGTIMAYGNNTLLYSNPSVIVRGERAGIEGERDNARALRQTIPVVAAFRSGGSTLPRENVPPPVPPPPTIGVSQPTQVRVTAVSATEVELRWHDNTTGELGMRVEGRRVTGSDDWEISIDLPIDTERHDVGGLEPATQYRFRVSSVGPSNTAISDEIRVTTLNAPPAAPAGFAAEPLAAGALRLVWEEVERANGYEVEVRSADPAADRAAAPIVFGDEGATLGGLTAATPYTVRVRAVNEVGASAWSAPASATTLGAGGPCESGADTLCLLGGRFEVRAQWRNPREPFGHGVAAAKPAPGSERTGLFTFFDPDNVELVVKMLDGRAANGAFWHFYGALSDVEYWVTVRDTAEDGLRTYHNEPFELCGRGDTTAFVPAPEVPAAGAQAVPVAAAAVAPRATAAVEGACTPSDDALCLAGDRFRVEVEWENPRVAGQSGSGKVFAGLDGDRSGHFWFFRPDNLELSVKILDGRALNGHFWIFWGGLSDVGYTIRVTDTESGQEHDFVNPPLTLCGGAETDVL
jgi:hypothetical protein